MIEEASYTNWKSMPKMAGQGQGQGRPEHFCYRRCRKHFVRHHRRRSFADIVVGRYRRCPTAPAIPVADRVDGCDNPLQYRFRYSSYNF